MERTLLAKLCATALGVGVLTACSGGGGDGGTNGSLSLALTDAPVDGVSQIWVEITGIRLHSQSGSTVDRTFAQPLDIDLLTLQNGISKPLLNGESVPGGTYDWLELEVNAKLDGVYDSYVVANGGDYEISVPSGSQTGLRLVSPFTVTANQQSSFVLDWNMRMGLSAPGGQTSPGGQQAYLLKPALRITDMQKYGTLKGTVSGSLLSAQGCTGNTSTGVGNAVYVYETFDTTMQQPDDMGGSGPNPVATADLTLDANSNYTYSLILSPDDYVVAFTCQASNDVAGSDENISFVPPTVVNGTANGTFGPVTVTDAGTAVVDF